jgi:GH25 family lysozyme M1 (1,4-beta-N-acetylmuramidase)
MSRLIRLISTDILFRDRDLAGAPFFLPPSIREPRWLFWQFHHRALRPGIRGPVDLDAFRGSTGDLAAIAR